MNNEQTRSEASFSIGAVLSESIEKTNGTKWIFQKAFALYFLVYLLLLILQLTLMYLVGGFSETAQQSTQIALTEAVTQLIVGILTLPLGVGLFMIGLRRAVDKPIRAGMVVAYYHKLGALFFTFLLMYLMILLGFICLILPGIYLAVAYSYALPLTVEKNLGPWEALETSRKAISKQWFTYFGLWLVMGLIVAISVLPLGIGLIWTLPMAMIAYGIVYRDLFGCEAETLADD
jgi:uncharacterized membrane protein